MTLHLIGQHDWESATGCPVDGSVVVIRVGDIRKSALENIQTANERMLRSGRRNDSAAVEYYTGWRDGIKLLCRELGIDLRVEGEEA